MMAKMFYTLEETKATLAKNEEEIKQLSREGRLREFRDGPRLMFKADQVEALKAELGGSDQVDLGPSDSGAPLGLVDSKSASGTSVTLTDSDVGGRSPGGGVVKEDTALAADLGLSGSVGGVPSPGRVGPGGSKSGSGVNVFAADEVEHADPSAQTAISSGATDQVNLESVGSGSGLLDLTRESDDTSLGAQLLDEIAPGAAPRRSATGSTAGTTVGPAGSDAGMTVVDTRVPPPSGRSAIAPPIEVLAPDASVSGFGAAAIAGTIMVLLAAFALIADLNGAHPEFLAQLRDKSVWFLWAIGAVGAIVLFVVGLIVGKSATR